MPIRERQYETPLGPGVKRRVEFWRDQLKILRYVVQLEVEVEGQSTPVVRYDASHGEPHKDEYKLDGQRRKELLNLRYDEHVGYRDALDKAEEDVTNNWERYIQRFRRGWWPT